MSRSGFYDKVDDALGDIRDDGLWKNERLITSPQGGTVDVDGAGEVLNFCANNYLGLADHDDIINGASEAMNSSGYGMASVRFICGTTDQHRALESEIADYIRTDDSILFAACFDANGGLFEPLLSDGDAIVSDSLNHASIIDGVRLCKANRYRFATRDIDDLRRQVEAAKQDQAETILIATDGVFSMDGYIADLPAICRVADEFDAVVMVDDCHATGLVGPEGRGTPSLHGVSERVDIVTSTLGKALGGAMGGFVAAKQNVVDLLRQRSRPYLFSNSLSPGLVGGARVAIRMAIEGDARRERLNDNAFRFRRLMTDAGFRLTGHGHPIIPVLLGEAEIATEMAARLLDKGVYVTAFSFPVVPRGAARIRTQMNAAHDADDIDRAVAAFIEVGHDLDVIGR